MAKMVKRLFIVLLIIVLVLGGALWWAISYIAPDEQLDMSYTSIDVKDKALSMVKKFKPELVLTESDMNNLIKMNIASKYESGSSAAPSIELKENVRLNGASFELEENKLIAHLNITYRDRIPAALQAEYTMEWESPNFILRPQSLSLKGIALPLSMLETIVVPIDLPAQDVIKVNDVQFLQDQIKILFKIQLHFNL